MKGFAVFVALAAVVAAQTSEETTGTDYQSQPAGSPDLASLGAAIEAQVYQEASLARAFLPNVLALQRAQYTMLAGQAYMQMLHLQHEEDAARTGKKVADFEEEDEDEDEDEEYGYLFTEPDGYSETDAKQVKLNLYASYYLFSAIKIKFLETLISAPDVQNAFWADRGFTYLTQSSGTQLPAEILQLLFLSQYKTSLETMKLSLALQMISHFTMWLEDEIDVSGALVDTLNPYSKEVLRDQSDDIVRDKLFAFSAYNTYAMVDLQIFYLETFLSAAMGQAGSLGSLGGAPVAPEAAPASETPSLLEEESESIGSFGAQDPSTIFQLYRVYFLMTQVSGAQAAYTSAFAEQVAIDKEAKGLNKEAEDSIKFARQLFGGSFANSLVQASQIEYQQAMLKLFILFQSQTGSTTGGSLGAGATAAAAGSLGAGAAASSFGSATGAASSFGPAAALGSFGPAALGLGSFGPAAGLGSFGPAAALGSLGAAGLGSFGPAGLGSFGPAAALGSLGAAGLGSFGPAGLGSFGPAAALGSLGAAGLGSFGPAGLGSFGPAAALGSLGAAGLGGLGSFGPAAALGSLGAASLGSFGPGAAGLGGLGSFGPAAALGSLGAAGLGSFGPAGLGSFGPAAALGSLGAASLGSFGPGAAGLGSFGPAAALGLGAASLGSFGPAAGLGSFGPAAALGSFGPGIGSFGPAAALGSFGPAAALGSFGPSALGSLGPAAAFGSM